MIRDYNHHASYDNREEHLAARLVESEMRRHGALALFNLGFTTAAREVLAGGYPDWPTLLGARRMAKKSWWVAFDLDTLALLRMAVATPDPRTTPLAIPVAA